MTLHWFNVFSKKLVIILICKLHTNIVLWWFLHLASKRFLQDRLKLFIIIKHYSLIAFIKCMARNFYHFDLRFVFCTIHHEMLQYAYSWLGNAPALAWQSHFPIDLPIIPWLLSLKKRAAGTTGVCQRSWIMEIQNSHHHTNMLVADGAMDCFVPLTVFFENTINLLSGITKGGKTYNTGKEPSNGNLKV